LEDKDIINAIYEIRERIVRIETKLDQYNDIRNTAYKAKELAESNEEKIKELKENQKELKENQKWAGRTAVGTLFGLIAKVIYDSITGR